MELERGRGEGHKLHLCTIVYWSTVGRLLAGIGEFGVRVRSEPNDHLGLARLHEFSFDLVPSPTNSVALARIDSCRLQSSIEFSLLSFG